jgi:uncharacterized protein YkwD
MDLVLGHIAGSCHTGICQRQIELRPMKRLAQQHSNDMARRNSMDHAGFHTRAKRGARAENVAMGSTTKAGAMAQWWTSLGHAANMLLPGCKAVAHAVSKSGRHYWTMLIGR